MLVSAICFVTIKLDLLYYLTSIPLFLDLSDSIGIQQAADLGLSESGLADIISSPNINIAASQLLDGVGHKGALFTFIRHPVDCTIVSYYQYHQKDNSNTPMTLQ
jgi:hypothetical protein